MLVSVVEIVKGPNGAVASVARLYAIDYETEESRAGGVYGSLSQNTLNFFDGLVNRELSPIIDVLGDQLLNGLEPGIVKGTPQVMNSIAHHEREVIENSDVQSMRESLCTVLRVELNNGSAGFMKSADACFDIANVCVSPVDF